MPAAPTVVTGQRGTGVGISSARLVVEMWDRIFDYDPDQSPTLVILQRRGQKRKTGAPTFNHLEDQPLPWWDTIGTAPSPATTGTTFIATNGVYFTPGDVIVVPTSTGVVGEIAKVTGVSGNTVTIIRNINGDSVTGGTWTNGNMVAIIGNVNEEGALSRIIKTTTESQVTNYTQIFKKSVGNTKTLEGTQTYGGNDRMRQRKKKGVEHAFDIERAFLFGKKREYTGTTGQRERLTGGLLSWISTNVTTVNAPITHGVLEAFAEAIFRYGSKRRLLIAGRRLVTGLDNIAEGRLRTVPKEDTYGVQIREYVTGHGSFDVAVSDMLINDYAGYAIAVDFENVMIRFMSDDDGNRDGRLETNIQPPDADARLDQYLSEVGLHVLAESSHGVLKGITA